MPVTSSASVTRSAPMLASTICFTASSAEASASILSTSRPLSPRISDTWFMRDLLLESVSLRQASCSPGLRRDGERRFGQELATAIPEPVPLRRPQGGDVCAGGADAKGERLPPLVEAGMLHVDGDRGLLDLAEPGRLEELRQVAPTRAGHVGL